jgi:branched-chain amino acid transport system permease protein
MAARRGAMPHAASRPDEERRNNVAQSLVVGLIAGGIYGLYAIGLVLLFKGSGALNFAQAEIGTVALFVLHAMVVEHHQPYLVGLAAAFACGIAISLVFERIAVWPLRSAPRLSVTIATIALLSMLVALELTIFGTEQRLLDPPIGGSSVKLLDVFVSPSQMLSVALVVGVGLALALFLRGTDFGLSIVASAQDQEAVRFLGIRLARVSMFTWALAGAMSVLAALLIQPTVGILTPSAFGGIFIRALGAALIGGLSSMSGAFAGGLLVGVAEAQIRHATIRWSLTGMPELCIFFAAIAVLVFRPQGLLGER